MSGNSFFRVRHRGFSTFAPHVRGSLRCIRHLKIGAITLALEWKK